MSAPEDAPRHEVAVLVRPGVRPMELGLVHQILGGARSADGQPLYRVRTCALHPGTVPTDADFRVVVGHGPELLARADTVLATQDDHEPSVVAAPGLGDALASLRPGTRPASICTAAFPLAEAGLLDGRRATTHWLSAEAFRCRFPRVDLDPAVLYVDEGEVLTAAGEASGIDPLGWLLRRRVERARELLETTDLPVGRIADEVGFGTATALRRHVCRELGVPPLHYRRTFRGG